MFEKLKMVTGDDCKQLECVYGEYHHEGKFYVLITFFDGGTMTKN